MSGAAPITGGCQCGAVRYRASGLGRSSVCHCRMCQRASGNVMAPLVVADGIAWEGTPSTWASSNISETSFCDACGTPLFLRDFNSGRTEVMAGTLDDPSLAPPEYHYGVESQVCWLKLDDGLPRKETADGGEGIVSRQRPVNPAKEE